MFDSIAIVGATGAVGQLIRSMLEERDARHGRRDGQAHELEHRRCDVTDPAARTNLGVLVRFVDVNERDRIERVRRVRSAGRRIFHQLAVSVVGSDEERAALGDDGIGNASDPVIDGFDRMPMSQEKFNLFPEFAVLMLKMNNTEQFKRAVDALVRFRGSLPPSQKEELAKLVNNNFMKPIGDRKKASGFKEQADYIYSMIQ